MSASPQTLNDPRPMPDSPASSGLKTRLRLLTYNIQVGVASTRFHHYLTRSWKHVLPHSSSFENLDQIAELIGQYDIVALQEADAGSLRSYFINQVEYIARQARFPFWYHQTNRNLGKFAQHSNGLLSKIRPSEVIDHKLPGVIPGRGAMMVRYGHRNHPLVILLVHLALGQRTRSKQLQYLARLIDRYEHAIVMGDFNCRAESREMQALVRNSHLDEPVDAMPTFPSWRPYRNIDHILVTSSLQVANVQVLDHALSDHLPIAVEVTLPEGLNLLAG